MKNLEGNHDLARGLYLVATPIGNLRDMSLRAIDTLRSVDIILCEDTRVSGKLMKAHGIETRMRVYHDHSDADARARVVADIQGGMAVALVSDAGMPLINDPGYKLVVDCRAAGLIVTSVPGASAPLAALQISGMPSDAFSFIGFLPPKTKARREVIERWARVPSTILAFETAPRLAAALADIAQVMGPARVVAVVREITKMYEEVRKASVQDLIAHYEAHGAPKGEIVLVIAPPVERAYDEAEVIEMIKAALKNMRTSEIAAHVAGMTGMKKSDVYALVLQVSEGKI